MTVDTTLFHIYDKKTNEPVKVCLTIDELEQLLAKNQVDWLHWEVQPCYSDHSSEEASY